MQIPTGALAAIHFDSNAILADGKRHDAASSTGPDPGGRMATLAQAFAQLHGVMTWVESDAQSGGDSSAADITEIGDYALQLLEALSVATRKRELDGQQLPVDAVAINIALWVARHSGRIDTLEPVANALALFTNSSREPAELGVLSRIMGEIIAAVSCAISQDLEKMNPGRPWRILLFNHNIVATRCHDADRMDALDYPSQVRKVMEKYHLEWPVNRSLHSSRFHSDSPLQARFRGTWLVIRLSPARQKDYYSAPLCDHHLELPAYMPD